MKRLVLAAVLAAASSFAQAGELSYSYVEGGYARVNVDADGLGDFDFDGAQIRGSAALGDSFYLFGGYGRTRNDDAGIDIDFSELQAGVGYHLEMTENADFIAELGYLRQEIDADDVGSEHASGGRVSVGVRGMLGDHVEGYLKGSYSGGGDFDGGFSGLIGAQVKLNQTWGIVGEIEAGEQSEDVDLTKYLIGVRASF